MGAAPSIASDKITLDALNKWVADLAAKSSKFEQAGSKFWDEGRRKALFELLSGGAQEISFEAFKEGLAQVDHLTTAITRHYPRMVGKDPDPLDVEDVLSQCNDGEKGIPLAVLSEHAIATIKAGSTIRESKNRFDGQIQKKQVALEGSTHPLNQQKHKAKLEQLQKEAANVKVTPHSLTLPVASPYPNRQF